MNEFLWNKVCKEEKGVLPFSYGYLELHRVVTVDTPFFRYMCAHALSSAILV